MNVGTICAALIDDMEVAVRSFDVLEPGGADAAEDYARCSTGSRSRFHDQADVTAVGRHLVRR